MHVDTLVVIRIPNYLPSLNILEFFYFEPGIILKLFWNTKGVNVLKNLRNKFQSLLMPCIDHCVVKCKYNEDDGDALRHHKTKQEPIFCIDDAKVHLKAVL